MQLAKVIGRATATIKHETLKGWRLAVIQPLRADGENDGPPQIAIDSLGSRVGSLVVAAADGSAAREVMNVKNSPARWVVTAQPDSEGLID